MWRSSETDIYQWYKGDNRKPLVIRGARQVGKTTLIRICAEKLGLELVEINLEKPFRFTHALAALNPKKLIEWIEYELNLDINPNKSLLFFDEVQAVPEIIYFLRYFYEETPEYAVVVTGSLLEFVLDEPNFSMPVGRINFLHIGPMSFEEFLQALGEKKLLNYLQNYTLEDSIPDVIHVRLTEIVKTYCIVGGMPEVVSSYVETGNMKKLNQVKNDIVTAFHLDFGKYKSKTDSKLLSTVFYKLPQLIGQKIKYVALNRERRAKELSTILEQLCLAKIIYKVYHSHSNGVPIRADVNANNFKVLFLDVGLAQTILGVNILDLESIDDLNLANKGVIAEQFIGQHLLYLQTLNQEPELHYWMREKKSSSAEIDYVISCNNQIIPIEVKSGKTGTLRSLHLFVQEKKALLAVRFNADKPTLFNEQRQAAHGEIDFHLLSLPHYLVGQLHRFILN